MSTAAEPFNIGYTSADVYEQMLPPHYYGGVEDVDLVRELLQEVLHAPEPVRRVLDLGCGTGRITRILEPYAAHLCGTDKSAGMIERFQAEFPSATGQCADTETVLSQSREAGTTFDLVGSFWSMSYPLLECFENTTPDGVVVTNDLNTGTERALRIVSNLVALLAPDGHLIMLFFDAHSDEQRLVTRLWERVHSFPGEGRDNSRQLLMTGLREAEAQGLGRLTTHRLPGVAVTRDAEAARKWFCVGHLNALPELVTNPAVIDEIDEFAARHTLADGRVLIPSGVHVIHFHATQDNTGHLPPDLR